MTGYPVLPLGVFIEVEIVREAGVTAGFTWSP